MIVVPLAQRPDVIPVLARWLYEEWGYFHEHDSIERRTAELSARLREDAIPMTFVALASAEPDAPAIGTAALTPDDLETRPDLCPWLASVLVDPRYRGRGVGSTLVTAVVAKARELGHRRLFLFTEDQQALYARLGWAESDRAEYRGHPITIMQREM